MSWHYLAEPEAESSVAICSDGVQWQPSKLKNTHAQCCCNGRLTDAYLDSLSGTMSEHSTDDPGADELTLSRADSLARTFPQLAKALEYQAHEAACGLSSLGSLAKYDPATHSLKTHQCSLFGDSTESLQTLPRWGMMRNGAVSERTMSVRHTSGTESGCLLPTLDCLQLTNSKTEYDRSAKSMSGWSLAQYTKSFPTPTASTMPCEDTQRIMRKKWLAGEMTLEEASAIAGRDVRKKQGKVEAVWPTPTRRDYKGDRKPETLEAVGRNATNGLPEAITASGGVHCGGQLNPDWVELLMGWPMGWTDITKPCHNQIPAWPVDWEGDTPRVTQKTPHRVERLKAIGNGQVPACAACAFIILFNRITTQETIS